MSKIAIIGGSAVGNLLNKYKSILIHTPYGETSSPIEVGEIGGVEVAVLYRHGKPHKIPPHKINNRANIFALNQLGIERVISISAVGSLDPELPPGTVVIPDQFFDFTKGRIYTFYDGPKVVHISMADPFCPELSEIAYTEGKKMGINIKKGSTYVCIEGPRFSTRAESRFFRQIGNIIGMTLVPEINLAREMGMCYMTLATVTDFDVWADKPVSASEVTKVMKENEEKVMRLLENLLPKIPENRGCSCKRSLEEASL
jgi:5''-deoxy-5''-methylthioadenosine phosphorylase